MHWALVVAGKVNEITALNPAGRFHPSLDWRPCGAQVQVGWIADQNSFTAPAAVITTTAGLCASIDMAADSARRAVAGDPLRAVEYDRARASAEAFSAAGFQGEVPAMVAAWVTSSRTPQQAAENILAEAALYTNALELLRTTRLQAKEMIRTLMATGEIEQAQDVAAETIAAIEAAVAGIGNNAN